MKNLKQMLRSAALASAAAFALVGAPALAAPVVSIDPVSQDLALNNTTSVKIIVSGLTQPADAVGGFSLTLGFNNTFLSGMSFVIDPGVTMGAAGLDLSGGFTGGSLDLYYSADAAETQASLAAAQGLSFVLATVDFKGIANGLSPLVLSNVVLSDWNGENTLEGVTSRNGSICVGGDCRIEVPEPATVLLVGAALGAMALRRRQANCAAG